MANPRKRRARKLARLKALLGITRAEKIQEEPVVEEAAPVVEEVEPVVEEAAADASPSEDVIVQPKRVPRSKKSKSKK
jgi:hypothetical protein